MKVSIIQCSLALGDVEKNFHTIEEGIRDASKEKPDVIVLPEMWNTSFIFENIENLADLDSKRAKAFLSNFAKEFCVNIVGGSVASKRDGKLYNTCYVYDRAGKEIASYNKAHLFSPSREYGLFERGNQISTFEIDGVKCGVAICYDVRFPEWIRKYALADVQVLFLPAAWPTVRSLHWDILNRARAIENQMFVVAVNSTGQAPSVQFGGRSAVIDPWGEYIIKPDTINGIKTGEIDLSVIQNIRAYINVFKDRREELY
ncbi:carbon-nitrogen family hydrolase [Treponema phagedenis]|uniref:Hydrolase MtnU n=1 Tax=Treponema phagedenis TaxID=162 RepID=A0A0B7GR67_TREPH|nr:carbon-nitrogen family hydrolase [Treponema phagedenis]QSH98897.1 carbon-nitrogen family hydrolase [Treponema phagedenis]CEM61089.1 Hydrolase MtnU [Treponema phagedenis]